MQLSKVLLGARRLALTTKHGHNYYKGTKTGSMGRHTKHGGYVVDYAKVRTYPAPIETTLTPFVDRSVVRARARRGEGETYVSGREYYENWKLL